MYGAASDALSPKQRWDATSIPIPSVSLVVGWITTILGIMMCFSPFTGWAEAFYLHIGWQGIICRRAAILQSAPATS